MASFLGGIILVVGLGFFGLEVYHLIKDIIDKKKDKKNEKGG